MPEVKFSPFPVRTAPSSKSPFADVVMFPLFGALPLPWATAATSKEFAFATPEYSKIAIRMVLEIVSDTVTWFAPPAIFSA